LIVDSIIFKSSTAYSNENEGIAINNKIAQGINVQTISKKVLCWIFVGNKKVLSNEKILFCKLVLLKLPKTNSIIKKVTNITIQIRKNMIS
jgi:hypothetical protein